MDRHRLITCIATLLISACSGATATAPPVMPDGPIVSRGLRVVANTGDAAAASDADYNTVYRSHGVPARLCWDLAPLPVPRRSRLLFGWFNDNYGYDHALIGRPGYNNPGDYIIEGGADTGTDTPPAAGLVPLASVTANTLHSRQHLLDAHSFRWLCLRVTRSDGSPRNTDVALQVDVYDVSGSDTLPGILFVGDSITAAAMDHNGPAALNDQMAALGAEPVPYENAGWPGATSGHFHAQLPAWLAAFPGRYVAVQIGTNDKDAKPADFRANMQQLLGDIHGAGKIAVLAPISYSPAPDHAPYTERLNAILTELLRQDPQVLAGPDFYAEYRTHPELIGPDGVHDTAAGSARRRELWARWFAARPELRVQRGSR